LSAEEKSELPPPLSQQPDYASTFDLFHHALTIGTLDKLVLSHPALIDKPAHFSLAEIFSQICQRYPESYVSLSYTPISGLWLGASPELLVGGQGEQWQTVSLAGTQEAGKEALWSDKNKAEQQIVTDYIKQQFALMKLDYAVGETQTVQAGHLTHLCTVLHFAL